MLRSKEGKQAACSGGVGWKKVLAVNASNINLANNYFAAMGLAI
jgi:hypothetical protein